MAPVPLTERKLVVSSYLFGYMVVKPKDLNITKAITLCLPPGNSVQFAWASFPVEPVSSTPQKSWKLCKNDKVNRPQYLLLVTLL